MNSFLGQLADDLLSRHQGDLKKICLVFPTRRAGLHFKKILSQKTEKPMWSPVIFSIEDFIASLSTLIIPDRLTLVFELFAVYKQYFPSESFDEFYPWGVMLLKDFDDADKSLADTKQLFAYIHDAKEIDESFGLGEEDKERLNDFWKLFIGENQGTIRKSFLENWRHLGTIHEEFKKNLLANRFAYDGLAARLVAEKISVDEISFPHEEIVFAGFYALSRGEEAIISHLTKQGIARLYWDADSYYTDDAKQEAGAFIRKSSLIEKKYLWKENLLSTDEKKIEMIGAPLQVLQTRVACQILSEKLKQENFDTEKTAVVLPDEQLLFPLLYSLPEGITDINVTMGYPLQASSLYNLIESLFDLQKSIRDGKNISFYYKNVLSVLSHPFLNFIAPEKINSWLTNYRESNRLRIYLSELSDGNTPGLFSALFRKINSVSELLAYFDAFFSLLVNALRQDAKALHSLEREYLYHFYTQFKRLEDIVKKYPDEITIETFRSLFREVIYTTRIPFAGEPLKGLQVMGFLETRVLDFENLIILSVNEDALPPASRHPSFIPFSIRKIFGLPTFEDNNAIAAYHFYRLLQRAKNIYLIYNTEVKSITAGERSRFLLQLENELCRVNPKIKLVRKIASAPVSDEQVQPVTIEKTADVMKELQTYFQKSNKEIKYARKFSASALTTYISCPLKFYFQYVIKLREIEETEESIESGLFGTILHEAMRSLYAGHQVISVSDFEKIKKQVEVAVDAAIKLHFSDADKLEGKSIPMRKVIVELVSRIIEFDRQSAPLIIKNLEDEFFVYKTLRENEQVILYGRIDRVDEVLGTVRIIDYKTGKVDDKQPHSIEELFHSPNFKEEFQTFFYSWLLFANTGVQPVKAGLYRLKKISEGIKFINRGENISKEQFSEFESHLKNLLTEIFNPEIPFAQTEDLKQCEYCAFKDICNR